MSESFVALGSNLGDRLGNLRFALRSLADDSATHLRGLSRIRCTKPVGGPRQPDYLNAVARIESSRSPENLLAFLLRIEARRGRERGQRNGPRTLDLDLLLYGCERRSGSHLTLPHPRLEERRFVLEPLHDLVPRLPLSGGREVRQCLADLKP